MNARIWSLVFAVVAAAQLIASEATVIGEWPEVRRGFITRVEVADGKAYLASTELLIVDVSNPAAPMLTGHVDVGVSVDVEDVAVRGSYAYVTAMNGFHTVDVANPQNPRVTASDFFEGTGQRVTLAGSRAYVSHGAQGVRIYDLSNPAAPAFIGATPAGFGATDVAVKDNFMFTGGNARIHVFDITDPASPVLRATFRTSIINALAISGNYLYAAADTAGIQIFDISNPMAAVEVARFANDGNADDISIAGNVAALADRTAGLIFVDISNPAAPVRLGGYEPTGNLTSSTRSVFLSDGRVFEVDALRLKILDVSALAAPSLIGEFALENVASSWLAIRENIAFLVYKGGISAIDVSNPALPMRVGTYREGASISRLVIKDHIAYVSGADGLLEMVDISNPAAMTRVGVWAEGTGYVVNVDGNLGFFSRSAALEIIDLTTPANPVLLGTYEHHTADVDVVGNLAYIATASDGLKIVDLQNPAAPVTIGSTSEPTPRGVVVNGNVAYVKNAFDFQIFDVSVPTAPRLLSTLREQFVSFYSMEASGDRVLLTPGGGEPYEILAVDASNPLAPRIVGTMGLLRSGSLPPFLKLLGGKIYASHSGLKILEPGSLATPVLNARLTPEPTFWLSGLAGSRYIVEHKANLESAQWTPLPQVTLVSSPQAIDVPQEARFVRARLAP